MCLVLKNKDLENKPSKSRKGKEEATLAENSEVQTFRKTKINLIPMPPNSRSTDNRLGMKIFKMLILFYFLTLLFISTSVVYLLVFDNFESIISYYIIIIVPISLSASLLLYNPLDILKYIKFMPAYFYYLATYINILQIYSICKTDDVSWGTETITKNQGGNLKFQKFTYKKVLYLILYILTNSAFGLCFEK
jgi:hypothetical protein